MTHATHELIHGEGNPASPVRAKAVFVGIGHLADLSPNGGHMDNMFLVLSLNLGKSTNDPFSVGLPGLPLRR